MTESKNAGSIEEARHTGRMNVMDGVQAFLQAWGDPKHPDNQEVVTLRTTGFGNINSTGELGNYEGEALSLHHPQFLGSIEPGVREFVEILTLKFNWITYTSCAGHYYWRKRLPPVERHVGILPRSAIELEIICRTLNRVVDVLRPLWWIPIWLDVVLERLESESGVYDVVDLFFRPRRGCPWLLYFAALNYAYRRTLGALRRLATVPS